MKNLDARQVELREKTKILNSQVQEDLRSILLKIEEELNTPLRLSQSFPTVDSKLNFASSLVSAVDNGNKVLPPIKKQVFNGLNNPWIDFSNQTDSGDFIITWPVSNTIGYFRAAGFTLIDSGQIEVIFSDEAATEGALVNPGELFANNGIPLGYIILECSSDIPLVFKTAGSASDIIENDKIFRFGTGGGGGGANVFIDGVAGESILTGDALYISKGTGDDSLRTAGRFYKLDVNSDDRFVFAGYATNDALVGEAITVQTGGIFEFTHGGAAGETLYGDYANIGGLTNVEPTMNETWLVITGIAIDANNILVANVGSPVALYIETMFGSVSIANGATSQPVSTLLFNSTEIKSAMIFYNIRRSTDTENADESGLLMVMYNVALSDWFITTIGGLGSTSVTFDITASGQVEYTSSTLLGASYTGNIDFKILETIKV
jgi:hypothetical protein